MLQGNRDSVAGRFESQASLRREASKPLSESSAKRGAGIRDRQGSVVEKANDLFVGFN